MSGAGDFRNSTSSARDSYYDEDEGDEADADGGNT